MASGCIFCKIARGEEEAYRVYRGHGLVVILDKYPVSKGHLLVIPEDHYEAVQDTPPRTLAKVWVAASALAHIYRVKLGAPGVKVLTNSGRIAGQVIFHFHVHVIPYWGTAGYEGRRVLGREEAMGVLEMLGPHVGVVEEYLRGAGLVGENEA